VLLKLFGAAVAILLLRPRRWSNEAIAGILALLWAWMGAAYHLWQFSAVNPAAYLFAGLSLMQGALFAWEGVLRRRLRFEAARGGRFLVGAGLLAYALLVYPQLSGLLGHHYPAMPTFGLPCPTTVFTIGVLVFLAAPYPRYVLLLPLVWCAVGTAAVFLFGLPQDLGLTVAGAVGVGLLLRRQSVAWWGPSA
jgi:hypothetical protein